jgi:hypothetical protein
MTSSDTYKGFCLRDWLTGAEMIAVLGTLGETTVEIYWKSDGTSIAARSAPK